MPVVTRLTAERRGRVAVELDGVPWRTIPLEALLCARLGLGCELDRARARMLRRELRRLEALGAAGRSLRARDLSAAGLSQRLERGGIAPAARAQTLAALARAGIVDDRRVARARAAALAERGYGDAWIRWDLDRQGIAPELVADALAELEPERTRAERFLRAGGGGERVARRLARRGFADDAVEAAGEGPIAGDG